MRFTLFNTTVLAILIVLTTCKKEEPIDNAIHGELYVYNEFGTVFSDLSGFEVTIKETGTTTTTNVYGKFEFETLPDGNYTAKVSKSGYTDYFKKFDFRNTLGKNVLEIYNYLSSNTQVTLTGFAYQSTRCYLANGEVSPKTDENNNMYRGFVLFVDTSKNVSKDKYLAFQFAKYDNLDEDGSLYTECLFKKNLLCDSTIIDTNFYAIAYGISYNNSSMKFPEILSCSNLGKSNSYNFLPLNSNKSNVVKVRVRW